MERYKEDIAARAARGDGASIPLGRRLLQGFFHPLTAAIEAEQEAVRSKNPSIDRRQYGPFLLLLNAEKLSVMTLHTMIGLIIQGEKSFTSMSEPFAGWGRADGAVLATS